MIIKTLIPTLFCFSIFANTVNTNELLTLDLDEIQKIVQTQIRKSQEIAIKSQQEGNEKEKEGDVIYELKKALLIIMARPNRDFMSVKVLPELEKQLSQYDAYYPTYTSLAKESVRIIADDEAPTKVKSAYLYVIENILAELQPELKNEPKAQKVFQAIADANIKIPKKLASFRMLEKMETNDFKPSKHAQKKLDEAQGKKKKPWWKFW